MGREPFEKVFRARLKAIEEDARKVGINMTVVCAEAGISRATPDRWNRDVPKTIEIVDAMEQIVEKHRLKRIAELGGTDASGKKARGS